ncbi:MAG: hypothetical protein GC188_08130 [Alphaproteobacteria bacterium]|nr:hypothetical protein [Alphaproteobacteria bacterium]
MTGFRTLLVSAASVMALIPAAEAQTRNQSYHECESNRQGRQVAGAVVGAILGGVLGAEIEDEFDDRDSYRGRGYRGHRGYGRHHGYDRYRQNERHSNDLAVVAGAGVGALVGAGVAGGQPCAPGYDNRQTGYYGNNGGYQDPYYDNRYNNSGYNNSGYPDDGYYQDGYYQDGYANDGYATDPYYGSTTQYGNEGLAGAPVTSGRVYQAGVPQNGNCRWMTTRSQNQYGTITANDVYMCQGVDGIWRPAQ